MEVAIPDGTPEGAVTIISDLRSALETCRSHATRQSIEADETLHELAAKLTAAQTVVEELKTNLTIAQAKSEEETAKRLQAEQGLASIQKAKAAETGIDADSKTKVEAVEREKRDLVAVCERLEEEKNSSQESLAALRVVHTSLQTSHSSLEASLQEAMTTSRTSLLRTQTLTSKVSSLEADKLFLTEELERSRSDSAKYRRESHAELIRLQTELDQHEMEERAAKSSLGSLRNAHDLLNTKHTESTQLLAKAREDLAVTEGNFTSEINGMKRLVDLMEKREEERKKYIEGVERAVDEEHVQRGQRELALEDALAQERERSDELENRCMEMREALERGARGYSVVEGDGMESPRSSIFALSPSGQMAVKGQKSGRSYAEIYSEYMRMEEELIKERIETRRLGECLAQILGDIEERAPLLKEQRMEYERLTAEASSLASQLAQTGVDRDNAEKRSEAYRLDVDRLERDNSILNLQLRDLGRQVRSLMRSLATSENASLANSGSPDDFDEEEEQIKKRADAFNDTDSVVSAHLVTFQTVNELQVQNQKLLRITREMGARLEREEETALGRRRTEENKAVEEAHVLIVRLKEEVETQRAKTEAFVRERDMFRRMLSQRETGTELVQAGNSGHLPSSGTSDSARMLAEVQANFDAYRTEISLDTRRLSEDLSQAQREANNARTELAKAKAHGDYLSERFQLLTKSYELQSGEVAQLSKRASQMQQTMARQDMAHHQMTEELIQLRTSSDQLRHENTNLKSEREVWKNVEDRLVQENTALNKERSHLADLMRNLQTMQNELERSASEARARLEDQVSRLDTQVAEMRGRLEVGAQENRQLAARREVELKQSQERIDRLSTEHQETRENLVIAKTTQEHLQSRVADLVLQVETKERKLAIYEGQKVAGGSVDATQTLEEQLEFTINDLRGELASTKSDLDRARAHLEQYKAISETQGESMQQMNTTFDEYKSSTDAALAEKEAEVTSLRERLHSLTTDLTAASTQNSDLHRQIENERVSFEKERKTFEDGLVNLRASDQAAREAQLAAQDDLRRQAQIAKEAHEKYERELVAHAEDVKRLSEIKEQLDAVRATVMENQSSTEVAKANLLASEASWTRQKAALEQEIVDLRKRSDDLVHQNGVLHEHLETVGSQATLLKSRHIVDSADSEENIVSEGDATLSTIHEESVDKLREVIRYLRREKDIVDLQLEFGKQEVARLKQQLDYTTRSLEETRQSLTEERQKAGETALSSTQHAELLERIHTAKLLRESNQTLRDENESNLRKVAQLESRLQQVLSQLEPLRERVQTLQAVVESKEHNIKLLEEDNERWKTRNQTILAKYERIDPEELQVLKDEVAAVKSQMEQAEREKEGLRANIEEQTKLAESMRSNWTNATDRFRALQGQARTTRDEKIALAKEVTDLKEKLEAKEAVTVNSDDAEALRAQVAAIQLEKTALEARLEAESTQRVELESQHEHRHAESSKLQEQSVQQKEQDAKVREDLEKRNLKLLTDNKKFINDLRAARDAEKKARESLESNNNEAIEKIVQERLGAAPPATDEDSARNIAAQVSAIEAKLAGERDAAIAEAVANATQAIQTDLEKVRAELTATSSSGSSSKELEQAKLDFEAVKANMTKDFERVKQQLTDAAAVNVAEVTKRLTAEIEKARSSAPAVTSTPNQADIDARVKAKLDAMEVERKSGQEQAIKAAVAEAVTKLKTEHTAELAAAKESAEKEAELKNKMLLLRVQRLTNASKAAAVTPAATSTLPAKPATTDSSPTPSPLVTTTGPATATSPVATRGTARGRGTRGVRGSVRGLAAQPAGGATVSALNSIRGAASGAPSLSLRGAASGRGGLLASLHNAADAAAASTGAPKRARDDESSVDASKRAKQGGTNGGDV